DLTDTTFARDVSEFAGNEIGEIVVESAGPARPAGQQTAPEVPQAPAAPVQAQAFEPVTEPITNREDSVELVEPAPVPTEAEAPALPAAPAKAPADIPSTQTY